MTRKDIQIELEMQNKELRRTHAELEVSQARYFDLYDLAPVGYITLSKQGLITEASLRAATLLGVVRDDLVQQTLTRFILPEDQDIYYHQQKRLLETGASQACELRMVKKEGKAFWANLTADPVEDAKGAPVYRIVIRDITERKNAGEELTASKDFIEAVLDNLMDSLIVMDPVNHSILRANKTFLDLYGLDKDTVIGKHCYELTHNRSTPCTPPDDICPLTETLKTGKPTTGQHIHYNRDGSKLYVEVSTIPIISKGGEINLIIHLSKDITERMQAQQLLQQQREGLSQSSRLATVGEFAASIAHEVQQPLAAILNNARAAQNFLSLETPAVDEARDALKDIMDDDRRASEVIRNLRSFLKRKKTDPAILDINAIIGEVLTILHREITNRDVYVTPDLAPDIPHIEGDRIELQQVIMNLILNGCDSLVNVDLKRRQMHIRTSVDEPNSIVVAVQDSGAGLDSTEINRVFEPFYTTKPEGLGMGLSISRSIIAAHGGRIWAVNNPEGGATFYFALPIYKGNALKS
ncbi:MAG TPA: PAS domain-containing protein [Syntrophales bacterium]|nr:PAS domain-containing protein [Syntrophales bacterium]